ncbi:aldehyde dehydrogenase [Noviherbaspirillum sp. Root189]|uniref:aldehyde dehydrogenase n=1 Tax=Noviherbaspirillum sp. Root189 TaxID=1736487 RepID=UPI00070B79A9|nr:aldehyde dehydrogenase [Noviherbaspirillum sp. Root189]KRB70664.1 aldehyde dehydrogenase [Noviherbaspirillum sp. Root189]
MQQQSSLVTKALLIGGEHVINHNQKFESVNPATGEVNYFLSLATASHVQAAVASAKAAANDPAWRFMLPHLRARLLSRIADGISARIEDLARLQMIENGKVWSECKAQAASAAAIFRYYASVCETLGAEITPSRGDYLSMTSYEPYGVVAAITPWNSPLTMEAQKVAPALAAGNAVILKPSEITPSTALLLGEIALEAGLPPGLLNVITGDGATTGSALVSHPDVRMVSFTGGTATGKHIARIAAERLIPVALELGGKSPHIIFDDANVDAALKSVVDGIFEGSGQSCIAGSRLFIQRGVYDQVVEALVTRAQTIKVDAPEASGAEMGPVAGFRHRSHVERLVAVAREEGGQILAGGARPSGAQYERGSYYLPTVIAGLNNRSTAVQQEIFGPVLCVLPFDDERDLVAQANDSAFGLASGIWTANYQRAWRVAQALETGLVWINTYKQLSISTPFGGFKESGIGREKGVTGVRLYQQSKGIYWSMDPANFPAPNQ